MLLKTGNSKNVCKKIFLVILVKNLNTFFNPSNVIFKMIFRANLLTKIFIIFIECFSLYSFTGKASFNN